MAATLCSIFSSRFFRKRAPARSKVRSRWNGWKTSHMQHSEPGVPTEQQDWAACGHLRRRRQPSRTVTRALQRRKAALGPCGLVKSCCLRVRRANLLRRRKTLAAWQKEFRPFRQRAARLHWVMSRSRDEAAVECGKIDASIYVKLCQHFEAALEFLVCFDRLWSKASG